LGAPPIGDRKILYVVSAKIATSVGSLFVRLQDLRPFAEPRVFYAVGSGF